MGNCCGKLPCCRISPCCAKLPCCGKSKNADISTGNGELAPVNNNDNNDNVDHGEGPKPETPDPTRRPDRKPDPGPAPDPKQVLTVRDVNLNIDSNTKAHRTSEYDICHSKPIRKLVVRRGQPFNVKIEFSKPYDKTKDDLRIVFEIGKNPSHPKGTEVNIILSDSDEPPKKWGAKILSQQGNTLTLTIFTPPTCFVGKWDFYIDVVKKTDTDTKVYTYDTEDQIYILFNPWCRDDAVYMEDQKLLEEYVLNETGRVYQGSANNITAKPWNYGQFESNVLDVALYLMDVAKLPVSNRGNAVRVLRAMSAVINANDEGGVLAGKWHEPYDPGTPPFDWTGSVVILEKYWDTKKMIKWGQCWVFACVATTVCRAFGIPTRTVTNFASAHDTDGSISIDLIFDQDGEPEKGGDSVWNFHVWNEAYLARPDLPPGYGGWQAFDATPQEVSGGIYACGPCSVNAIKQGEVNLPNDAPFVFAEVNGDSFYWQRDATGGVEFIFEKNYTIGKSISTKLPNSDGREDITENYKCREGTAGERAAVRRANLLGSTRPEYYPETPQDVKFEILQDCENTWVGNTFEVAVKITNTSEETRRVCGRVVIDTMYYTGVVADRVLSSKFMDLELAAGQTETVTYRAQAKDYIHKLKDCCMLDVSSYAKVKETNQTYIGHGDYRLRKPHLNVKGPNEATKGQEFCVEVSFSNPLEVTLKNCHITVDGLGRALNFPQPNVGPKNTFVAKIPITPTKIGYKEIIFCFGSTQLENINASKRIFVRAC